MQNMKSLLIKTLGIMLMLSALLAFFKVTPVLAAAPYPSKSIQLILPMAVGGTTDLIARLIAAKLSERLGQQVIVDNRGGGGGVIAIEGVAKAAPDGYTLLLTPNTFATQPALQKNLPYDPIKGFAPIAKVAGVQYVLIVHPKVPANSMKELIALAKQKPGKLIFADAGYGGSAHMGEELLKMLAGIDFMIVHYKGAGPATTDLLGGHSDVSLTSLNSVLPQIKSGKFKALGTAGARRSTVLPDVPTIAESLPGFLLINWIGILAPAGTPAPIVDRLSNEIKAVLAQEEVITLLMKQGSEVDYEGPTEFGKFIEQEINKWVRVVKEANIKLE
jgi:tripartite-type tricarboxylate transporter receptor subunit TctC